MADPAGGRRNGGTDAADVFPRRAFLATVATATAAVTLLTAGQTVPALRAVNVFGPRDGSGPQGLPVNKTAVSAEVVPGATDPGWRLLVTAGRTTRSWSRPELLALPQTEVRLPIACVEGWSASALWSGVPLRDLLDAVDADPRADLQISSIQPRGAYRVVEMGPEFARHPDTLVALGLNGSTLDLDHGFPARMIAPNRPGVLQTKWLQRIEVLT
ncbi:molybdopterin-dependent oxidoreductase [Microlunatus capsulatus]|uniref:DMSO/TMAO reductase YedYZ molybdopterin-dependent catalytic subunit n=1 Tax=Microlunatus capsulatus TaxID=99117 RepID=A0ABS4ZDL9_9ACTN|nr:molybdopterin-dependent oxidoreductase [Microlunatus capsulatus]MBP2419139.1 DMSO/TMAO reductase YedYZ molybdopterin-dependent catalytic subunit [Microlunatus capsulatus]